MGTDRECQHLLRCTCGTVRELAPESIHLGTQVSVAHGLEGGASGEPLGGAWPGGKTAPLGR